MNVIHVDFKEKRLLDRYEEIDREKGEIMAAGEQELMKLRDLLADDYTPLASGVMPLPDDGMDHD